MTLRVTNCARAKIVPVGLYTHLIHPDSANALFPVRAKPRKLVLQKAAGV